MRETVSEFRELFLIYCIDLQPDGTYVALNRRYKPLGMHSEKWVDYEDVPVARFKFKRALSARQIVALSYKGDASAQRIQLYNDGCVPTASAADWMAYSKRLQRLAGYVVLH